MPLEPPPWPIAQRMTHSAPVPYNMSVFYPFAFKSLNFWIPGQKDLHPVFSEWLMISTSDQNPFYKMLDLRMRRRKP
jgi:hypothetical protein